MPSWCPFCPRRKMPRVQVEQGELVGVECDATEGRYVSFKGIPYAKPPLGKLRFKAPMPPDTWEGVRDATEHGPICPQYHERLGRIEPGNEDCLYLNVYTKSLTPSKPLPVMVWIHGGSFYTGSGDSEFYGPEFFLSHDIVLVTFNYRLEVLGFLCLDNEEVPGNAGLKDQVAALKWIKRNINKFGGDSDNITVFGCSAGAVSISCHLVSKMSEGLFNKAICQSGICLSDWSYNLHPRDRAFQLGKLLGTDTADPEELLQFLRNIPASSLINIKLPPLDYPDKDITDLILFGPVIEKSHLKIDKFITETPIDLVRKGQVAKVPIIVGYTSGEGIEIGRSLPHLLGYYSLVGSVVPRELKLKWKPEKIKDADLKIRKYYFKGDDITTDMLKEVVKFETDRLFSYNIQRFARYHVQQTEKPAFLYIFRAESERNLTKSQYKMDSVDGVCHADELPYLFNVKTPQVPITPESMKVIKQFVQLWVNFATSSNPSPSRGPQWKPFTEREQNCFIIDSTLDSVLNPDVEHMKFWDEIYEENFIQTSVL